MKWTFGVESFISSPADFAHWNFIWKIFAEILFPFSRSKQPSILLIIICISRVVCYMYIVSSCLVFNNH
jgi:hypothetical protein